MGTQKKKSLDHRVLTKWRELMGYSEREAVRTIGCSRETWSGWEKGEKKIPKYIGLAMAALAMGMKPYGVDNGDDGPYKETSK